jgi:hypothetical protein
MPIRFAIQNRLFTLTKKNLTFREKQPYLASKLHPKPHCKATLWGNVVPTPFRRAVKPALSGAKDPSSTVCLHLCSVGIPRSALHLPHFHVGVCGGFISEIIPAPCSKHTPTMLKMLLILRKSTQSTHAQASYTCAFSNSKRIPFWPKHHLSIAIV